MNFIGVFPGFYNSYLPSFIFYLVSGNFYLVSHNFYTVVFTFYLSILFIHPFTIDDWVIKRKKCHLTV